MKKHHKDLLANLVKREIATRYKQSILGFFWVILNPFFQMLVMTLVFSKIMRIKVPGVPYFLFLYSGLLFWNFFTNSLNSSMNNLISMGSLIKKVYFPREIIILASLLAKGVDLVLASLLFVIFMIVYQQPTNILNNILFVPLIFIIQVIFTYGIALFISAMNLFYRDVQYLMGLILMLWFYLTPVIYPVEMAPERLRFIFAVNPMSVLTNAYRQVILGGTAPNLPNLGIALIVSLITLFIGCFTFRKLEGKFADVV
jgi:lipopolysaccharide transport system permease protein